MSIPQDILAGAEDLAAQEESIMIDNLQEAAPRGQFSAEALNRLVEEVNNILPKIGLPLYPAFTEDITVFPPEFVDVIVGISSAADEAGIETEIDLGMIEEDRDIAMLAGIIADLAADEAFLAAISEPAPEEVVEETVVEEPMPGGGEEVIEDEELFMQRM
tara:strand:+ start:907 stop:1389 length:483 start_codon:yes stop_codon:yes gene_type:complete